MARIHRVGLGGVLARRLGSAGPQPHGVVIIPSAARPRAEPCSVQRRDLCGRPLGRPPHRSATAWPLRPLMERHPARQDAMALRRARRRGGGGFPLGRRRARTRRRWQLRLVGRALRTARLRSRARARVEMDCSLFSSLSLRRGLPHSLESAQRSCEHRLDLHRHVRRGRRGGSLMGGVLPNSSRGSRPFPLAPRVGLGGVNQPSNATV